MKFPNHIRILRERLGLTQADLGKLVGIPQTTVSTFELGRRGLSEKWIFKFAEALRVPITELFPSTASARLSEEPPQNGSYSTDWLNAALQQPGKTSAGLARALDIDPSAVTRMKNGQRRLRLRELPKACAYLGVSHPYDTASVAPEGWKDAFFKWRGSLSVTPPPIEEWKFVECASYILGHHPVHNPISIRDGAVRVLEP